MAENERLRAEIEQLKRNNARSAAPFSKNKRKKNPKRPGRKPGLGPFNNRPAPPEEAHSAPPVDVPVTENNCPECGGELGEETEETGAAAFSAFKSVIGTLKKGGGDVLEKLTNLIAASTSQEIALANTS